MHSLKEFFKDLGKYIPAYAIPAIVSFISVPLFTRYILPDEWGRYTLTVNTAGLLTTISGAWLSSSIIRFYEQSVREKYVESFTSTVIGLGLLSVVLVAGISSLLFLQVIVLPEEFAVSVIIMGLWLSANQTLSNVLGSILRAKRKAGTYAGFVSWQSLAGACLGFLFIKIGGMGFEGLILGSAIGLCLGLIAFSSSVVDKQTFQWNRISRPLAKSMLLYGLSITGTDISYWLLRLADRYILGIFRPAHEVGIYSVGYDLSDGTLGVLITLLTLSSWPLVVRTWERDGKKATSEFLTQLMRVFLILCVPAVVAMSLMRELLMSTITSAPYFQGNQIIPLIVTSTFFFGFQRLYMNILALYKKPYLMMIAVLASGLINVILNFIFVPSYGYQAAAIINLVSYVLFASLIFLFSRHFLIWRFPFESLFKSILSSIVMAIAIRGVLLMEISEFYKLVLCVVVGGLIYFAALFISKENLFDNTWKLINQRS